MFEFDFGLGEELDLLRNTVRDFAADRIAPRAGTIDETNEFPADLWPELGSLGLLGITVGTTTAVRSSVTWHMYLPWKRSVARHHLLGCRTGRTQIFA